MQEKKEQPVSVSTDHGPLKQNLHIFNNTQKQSVQLLLDCNQSFIFNNWPKPGTDDAQKKELLDQVNRLNKQYPAGIVQYYQNGKRLLQESFKGVNPYAHWKASVPEGVNLKFNSNEYNEFEKIGKENASSLGFVLVAGGLGERLGYSGIKIELPMEITSEMCYLEYYIRFMLTLNPDAPFMIMTSGDTHDKTLKLLNDNKHFGMTKEGQITLLKQESVPTFSNNKCEFGMTGKYELGEKPHGHGDVHSLLFNSGLSEKWRDEFNIKYLAFFQDTNPLAMRALISTLGVSIKHKFAMNSIAVPRKAGEAIGCITKLVNVNDANNILTVNVEYNQLASLLADGDVNDPQTGYSRYPGNTNTFIIDNISYIDIMRKYKGAIPEFVNPKYTDETRTKFQKPTRLECMMQEYPKLCNKYANECKDDAAINLNCGMTCFPEWAAFQPVKSNIESSIKQFEKMGKSFGATHGEESVYFYNRELLRASVNNKFIIKAPRSNVDVEYIKGLPVKEGAKIVLYPTFGITIQDITQKITNYMNISERSTLIVEGNVQFNGLKLDGTLVIRALNGSKVIIQDLTVVNKGYHFQRIDVKDDQIEEKYRIRGYVLKKREEEVFVFGDGKEHTISSNDLNQYITVMSQL